MKLPLQNSGTSLACRLLVSAICCGAACSGRAPPPRSQAGEVRDPDIGAPASCTPLGPEDNARDSEPDTEARRAGAVPVAPADGGHYPLAGGGGSIWRNDRRPMTEEERRKEAEVLLEAARKIVAEHPPSEPPPGKLSENLRERVAQKITEERLVDEALQRLQRKIRNFVINKQYHTVLRVVEADPDFVKYRDHPRFKELHEDIGKLLAGTPRGGDDDASDPEHATDASTRNNDTGGGE